MGQSCPIEVLFATFDDLFATRGDLFASHRIYLQLLSKFATFIPVFARLKQIFAS